MNTALYADRTGFVYVLGNPHMPGLLKIGATRKHPVQRVRELGAATGVPGRFTLDYYRDFDDCFRAEAIIHQRLDQYRTNESREFFSVTLEAAIEMVDTVSKEKDVKEGSNGLTSGDLTGGEINPTAARLRAAWVDVAATPTPWADLFASFGPGDGDSPDELTPEESRRCRELGAKLHPLRY